MKEFFKPMLCEQYNQSAGWPTVPPPPSPEPGDPDYVDPNNPNTPPPSNGSTGGDNGTTTPEPPIGIGPFGLR